jgi:hypothetical protein
MESLAIFWAITSLFVLIILGFKNNNIPNMLVKKNTNIKYNYTNLVLINVCFSFVFSIQDVLNILGHCPIASPPFSLRRWMNVVRGTTKTLGLLDSLAEERSSRFQPKNGGQNPDTVGTPKKSCLMDVYSPSVLTHPQVINMMKQDWQI